MNGRPEFFPILSRHAIERCAASVGFTPALPEKAFERLVANVTGQLGSVGFVPQKVNQIGFVVGPDGQMTVGPSPSVAFPRHFLSANQTINLQIAQDGIVWNSTSYVRWQPYIGEFERFVLPLLGEYLDIVSISGVKLEYLDRFIWSGDWENFDVASLLKVGSPMLSQAAATKPKQWHSHAGWFEKEGDLRRLTNVNVEVSEVVAEPAVTPRPSVSVYSMITDQANVAGYGSTSQATLDRQFVIDRLENQHLALKHILGHIINEEMANRIGLFSRKPK